MSDDMRPLIVDGKRVTTARAFPVVNPATEGLIAHVASAHPRTVEAALAAAERAFGAWSRASLAEREQPILRYADLLERERERLIGLLISETGKPYDNASYDLGMLITCLRYFTEEARRVRQEIVPDPDGRFHHYLLRQPLGVVVGFLAWNFPLLNLGYKIGPVLASGCTAVVKPSRHTPLATLAAAELMDEAGLPPGVVNVIAADDHAVTNLLLESDVASLVTMIGSTPAGLEVMRSACTSIKHFSLELGGNAPAVVYPDADVEDAASKVVDLKLTNAGQVCVSPNRCFVHETVYDDFIGFAAARAGQFQLGSGRGVGPMMGPLISREALERVLGLVEEAVARGARVVCGGGQPADPPRGFFMQPTVLADARVDMRVAREEIFGPVLPVIRYSDSDDVLALANATQYGLAAYVFTRDVGTALRAAEGIQAGSVCVNEPHYAVHLPHGGLKQSGIGRDISAYGLEEYLTLKRVSVLTK